MFATSSFAARVLIFSAILSPAGFVQAAPNSLARSMQLWRDSYQASAAVPVGWTSSGGANGTASEAYRNATLARVNYFRSMAGLNTVTRDATFDFQSQEAAVMMSAAGKLSHTPTNDGTWPYFSNAGATGAGASSLSLGSTGPTAIDDFVDDSTGQGLGHRRYVFNPTQVKTGIGIAAAPGYNSAMAEYTLDLSGSRPAAATTPYTAWPSPGYVPYSTTNNFWSISLNHDFNDTDVSGATVVLKKNGVTQPIAPIVGETKYGLPEWYADPTVAFTSSSFSSAAPATPTTYSVTIANVKFGGVTQAPYSYDVTLFDPAKYKLAPGLPVSLDPAVSNSDLNHDGQINFDDLVILAQSYITKYTFDDLVKLAQSYNTTYPILITGSASAVATTGEFASVTAVPEPTGIAIAGGVLAMAKRRRRQPL